MSFNTRNIFFSIIILAIMAGIYACSDGPKEGSEAIPGESSPVKTDRDPRISELMASLSIQQYPEVFSAPDFELPSVKGGKVSIAEFRGKIVLVSFWATW